MRGRETHPTTRTSTAFLGDGQLGPEVFFPGFFGARDDDVGAKFGDVCLAAFGEAVGERGERGGGDDEVGGAVGEGDFFGVGGGGGLGAEGGEGGEVGGCGCGDGGEPAGSWGCCCAGGCVLVCVVVWGGGRGRHEDWTVVGAEIG